MSLLQTSVRLLAASLTLHASAQDGQDTADRKDAPVARVVATTTPPVIDGVLDDAVWQTAPPIGPLTQVVPVEGATPSERTEIRLLYDRDHLYIGIRCFDSEPDKIITTTRLRDAFLDVDDRIELVLDTFLDRRNAFFFQINAGGSKGDALVTDNGNDFNKPWNGIWEGESTIDAGGWSTEWALPFKTLNFREGLSTWGLNVQRFIGRRLEEARWSGASQDYGIFNIVHAGDITGIEGIRQGIGLDVVPFFVGGMEYDRTVDDRDLLGTAGFDAFYKIIPSLTLSLTANTDFAETEVDSRQINRTRFPLFFPEQRDFFLQDSGVFNVPTNGGLRPFFSRRIGLFQGQEVPILAGLKLTGRAGDYNIGVLDVQTRDETLLDGSGNPFELDGQNLFAARVSKNIGEQSSIGTFVTHGSPDGTDNSVIGLDGSFRTSSFLGDKNLRLSVFGLKSETEGPDAQELAYGASLSYPNDLWSWFLGFHEVQKDFNPELGFVPRGDVRRYDFSIGLLPRPEHENIRFLEFSYGISAFTNTDNVLETVDMELQPFGLEFESGDGFRFEIVQVHDELSETFAIRDTILLGPGNYDYTRGRFEFETSETRKLSAFAVFEFGSFFNGSRTDYVAGVEWRPSPLLISSLEYSHREFNLDDAKLVAGEDGRFEDQIARLRANFSFSPQLGWNNFVQWDNDSDTFGINSRLLWIPEPGNEVFLVFNETLENANGSLSPTFQDLSLKVGYTIRF